MVISNSMGIFEPGDLVRKIYVWGDIWGVYVPHYIPESGCVPHYTP